MAEKDIFRDTLVRYLGYANEVGEAFRDYIGHRNVMLSYGVSTGYCLADTIDKTMKCYQNNRHRSSPIPKTVYTAFDTMGWQLLASVLIPGFTINRVCHFTKLGLKKSTNLPSSTRKMIVTATGLLIIPLIIHPIDRFVDALFDNTVRKLAPR